MGRRRSHPNRCPTRALVLEAHRRLSSVNATCVLPVAECSRGAVTIGALVHPARGWNVEDNEHRKAGHAEHDVPVRVQNSSNDITPEAKAPSDDANGTVSFFLAIKPHSL